MATELIERTVITLFDDDEVVYERVSDDCVEVVMPTRDSLVRLQAVDQEIEPPMLTLRVVDFVRFPDELRDLAVSMCNELNLKGIGKFVTDDYGDVSFRLDSPTSDAAGPDEFRNALIITLSWFTKMYPVIMKVRWADMTVEEAIDALARADEDEEGGGDRDRIMTDEDIRNLLMRSGGGDPDDEDGGE